MITLAEIKADLAALVAKIESFGESLVTAEAPVVEATAVQELEDVATGDTKDTGHTLAAGVQQAEQTAIGDAVSTLQPIPPAA